MKKGKDAQVSLIPSIGDNGLFHRAYELLIPLIPEEKKVYLGDRANRECRFCGKGSNEVSFKMKAHILPEFMGNKHYFSYYECDSCNQYFGTLEDSLFNFAGILNSISSIKGKRGYSKFKDKGVELKAKDFKTLVASSSSDNKDDIFTYDEKQKRMNIETFKPSYISQNVYKALVKIALCMMPYDEFRMYGTAIDWLMKPNTNNYEHNPFFNVFQRIGGKHKFSNPLAFIYKKRNSSNLNNFPHHILLLNYGIISYQIFVPFHVNDNHLAKESEINFPIEEHILYKDYEEEELSVAVDRVNLSSPNKTKKEKHKFSFGFNKTE